MALITTNYSNLNEKQEFKPLPEGEYEMVIKRASENVTPNGKETFQIVLVVRNDLTQVPELAETNGKHANRYIFNDNWKRKATNQYDLENFQHILKACGVPEGTDLNSMEDIAKAISGRPARVFVKKEFSEYKGEEENNVAPWNYSRSQYPMVNHEWSKEEKNDAKKALEPFESVVEMSEDDIPF